MSERNGNVSCDAYGCQENYRLTDAANEAAKSEYDAVGFGNGRWLGWCYLDLNRPDLFPHVLHFCSTGCAMWWLERECITRRTDRNGTGRELTELDRYLRARPNPPPVADELRKRRTKGGPV